ncbi:hypothetical protein IFR05_016170 [Cadophora sp. M221]|nr:hypothetical protein IFR05_016170 [Cadophora sp. M221]
MAQLSPLYPINGLVDVRDLTFVHMTDTDVKQSSTSWTPFGKNLTKKREDAAKYRQLCKRIRGGRNTQDYERLFKIRY